MVSNRHLEIEEKKAYIKKGSVESSKEKCEVEKFKTAYSVWD